MSFFSNNLNYILGILVLLAIALAGYTFQSSRSNSNVPVDTKAPISQAERELVLNPPSSNASEEERRKYFDVVSKYAEKAAYLEISNCEPNPFIFQTKLDQDITIKNSGSNEHKVRFSSDRIYTISPGGDVKFKTDFSQGVGYYPYGCDTSTKPIGIFQIVP